MKKSAFVAVVGRPSAGKSTLINQICGQKVSIVSAVPQTTRNAIRGIYNGNNGQLVFIDTPGRYISEKKSNLKLKDISEKAVNESDIILYVLDASRAPGCEETEIASLLAVHAGRITVAVNKTDLLDLKTRNDVCRSLSEFLNSNICGFRIDRCFYISAKNNEGIEPLLTSLFDLAPEGEPFYGEEFYTDQEVDFRISEIIREQAINRLRQELPHSIYVKVADTSFTGASSPDKSPKLLVRAFILVERESQIGIVVGKGGSMIKAIRLASLREMDKIFDWKIDLDLRVKINGK